MWYFTFTHNCDNVLKINHLTRTRIFASLPGLVFRRRRAVFILLPMPPTSTEGGVRGVGWLIQASAWNQTCRSTNGRCEALASAKGCFLCFCFCATQYLSAQPSCACLTNDELVVCSMKKKHPHRWGCGCLVLLSVWGAIIRLCRRYRALLWSCGCRVLPSSRVLDRSICVGRILLAFQWTPCEQQRWMPNESRYRCWFCKQRS